MEYNITHLSYYAKTILKHLKTGTIHSVYRRTINLTDGSNILSLQSDHSPLSPISLITACPADGIGGLEVKPGDAVVFDKDGLHLQSAAHSHHFTFKDAICHDLRLSDSLDSRSCSILVSRISDALSSAAAGGFASLFSDKNMTGEELSLILRAARDHILHSSELCARKDYPEAALELSRLLGLGIGLTPSGDDFLCGVLAGLHFSGNNRHIFAHCLKNEIAGRLTDTIDISAAFLSCALDGQYSLPVNMLYQLPDSASILAAFGEIGHSSGTDTLCGILWSLKNI